jgi:putative ABC transport system substrate-binding protein
MNRRTIITLIGGAAAWPIAARGQKAMPVIGFLGSGLLDASLLYLAAFRKGLGEAGFVEGQNVAIEYRWAEGQLDRLPDLAGDLVRRRVSVIATPDTPASSAAVAATATIPVVFSVGEDPVRLGLVASLARPGGNATGFNFFTGEVVAKRLGLLKELVPAATRIGVLIDPADAARAQAVLSDAQIAARPLAVQIESLNASTSRELEAAFAMAAHARTQALFVSPHAFFNFRRGANRHACGALCDSDCLPGA